MRDLSIGRIKFYRAKKLCVEDGVGAGRMAGMAFYHHQPECWINPLLCLTPLYNLYIRQVPAHIQKSLFY